MNVVKLEAGLPGEPSERLAHEKPGVYVVEPDETAMRAMEKMLEFHRHPQPIIDYSRLPSLHPDAVPTQPVNMPALQAPIHEVAAAMIEWEMEHTGAADIELS